MDSATEWSKSEKKIARRAFEAALDKALARAIADFKTRAAAVSTPLEMWTIGDDLRRQRREIDALFDYRLLATEACICPADPAWPHGRNGPGRPGRSKAADIRRILSFFKRPDEPAP